MQKEQIAYVNGNILPESQASVSINDRGFIFGDAVFDTARTFNGKLFFLEDHVDRLFDSCKYLDIDPVLSKTQIISITKEVLSKNISFLEKNEDFWVTQRVTRGLRSGDSEDKNNPTIVVSCRKIIFRKRAAYFVKGIPLQVSSVRRTSPSAISPRAKTHNYLNMVLAENEVGKQASGSWAVLLDERGNLCEGLGCNLFLVKNGILFTPSDIYTLAGITRKIVIDLAKKEKIEVIEKDLDLYDAMTADEIFLTSTSLCICPAISFNGITIGEGKIPGPLTTQLQYLFKKQIDMDFIAQYFHFFSEKQKPSPF